jgi:hypothetical protein
VVGVVVDVSVVSVVTEVAVDSVVGVVSVLVVADVSVEETKQHAVELHLLFNGAQWTVNTICCHQTRSKSGRSVQGSALPNILGDGPHNVSLNLCSRHL